MVWLVGISLAALALIAWGVRGKVVHHGPMCAKCRFDVAGLKESAEWCPECGSSITSANGVLHLTRRRRPAAIVAGVLLLVGCVAHLPALSGILASQRVQVSLPAWALMIETHLSASLARAALNELTVRLPPGGLQKHEVDALTNRALALQGDLSRQWIPEWGDFVVEARKVGLVSDEQWVTYAKQGFEVTIESRDVIHVGSLLPTTVRAIPTRLGTGNVEAANDVLLAVRRDPSDAEFRGGGGIMGLMMRFGASTHGHEPINSSMPGEVHVNQVVRMLRLLKPDDPDGPGVAEWPVTLNKIVRVVPADVPIVKPVRSEALRRQIEQALFVHTARVFRGSLEIMFMMDSAPAHLVYEVFIRATGPANAIESRLGAINIPSGKRVFDGVGMRLSELPALPETVDVILRPSVKLAEESSNVIEFLDEEIVIANVRIEREQSTQ